jgi:hypothetical protein
MRPCFAPLRPAAGALGTILLIGTLALGAAPTAAGHNDPPPEEMLLVVPWQSVPTVRQLNPDTDVEVLRLAQMPLTGGGAPAQTAVVDLLQAPLPSDPPGSLPLFLFPQDLPLLEQLNGGAAFTSMGLFQAPPDGGTAPVAQVAITEPGQSQDPNAPAEFVMFCPAPRLPAMAQMNPGLQFDLHRIAQVPAGGGQVTQTALVGICPNGGSYKPDQSLPLYLPASEIPTLQQLNMGAAIDVVNVSPAGSGKTGQTGQTGQSGQTGQAGQTGQTSQSGQTGPIALVHLSADNAAIDRLNQGAPG